MGTAWGTKPPGARSFLGRETSGQKVYGTVNLCTRMGCRREATTTRMAPAPPPMHQLPVGRKKVPHASPQRRGRGRETNLGARDVELSGRRLQYNNHLLAGSRDCHTRCMATSGTTSTLEKHGNEMQARWAPGPRPGWRGLLGAGGPETGGSRGLGRGAPAKPLKDTELQGVLLRYWTREGCARGIRAGSEASHASR